MGAEALPDQASAERCRYSGCPNTGVRALAIPTRFIPGKAITASYCETHAEEILNDSWTFPGVLEVTDAR